MTTVVTGVRLQVDGSGAFVGQLREVRAAVAGIGEAERETASASGQMASATGAVAASAATAATELVRAATAANENAVGMVRASGAANQYATMASQLRAELDPMFAVQQRYDQELARADALFEAGAISGREYAAAQQLANDNLRAGAAAIFQNNGAQEQLNRNLGLQRAGWQGVGFQLQDVFASYASGIALTTIFAQQSGQMTSSLAMIAQGSENAGGKMSGFASFMSGPWGIAIGVAVSVIGALAVAFLDAEDKADGLSSKSMALSDALTTAKRPGANIIYDGKDEGEAIMAALADAIGDGAIKGVSAAVQKALKSSKDVDKALKEAMKVQDVELLLGGLGAQLAKEMRAFEQQAKERLRVAREYGFDVLKMEEQNAKDRLKLTEKLLRDQVGSLQDLITEMTAGSLYEGSAVDKRDALKAEIEKTKAKVAAGEEGAADLLARQLQNLNELSKEVYGTTGGFAADRAAILATAEAEVARAKQEIEKAQAATDPAVVDALDENNDQNARMLAELGISNEYLRQLSGVFKLSPVSSLAQLARTS